MNIAPTPAEVAKFASELEDFARRLRPSAEDIRNLRIAAAMLRILRTQLSKAETALDFNLPAPQRVKHVEHGLEYKGVPTCQI